MNTLSSAALLSGKRFCGAILLCLLTTIVSSAQTFNTIASFNLNNGGGPVAPLIQGLDGNFYGTTADGGNTTSSECVVSGCGTVFQVTPGGTVTTLYAFCSRPYCSDGAFPYTGLALGPNGNLYGTTFEGGNTGRGTVFELTPQGKITTLHSFCAGSCVDGSGPLSGLTLGPDGYFYGTTLDGGAGYSGSAYKISPAGFFLVLYNFCSQGGQCPDGIQPAGPLSLASNGKLYGTTTLGGLYRAGTIFQLSTAGVVTVVHAFSGPADQNNVANGVMQAADGNLYGAALEGGTHRNGYVFRLTPAGQFTNLYSFCAQSNCSDGMSPRSQLIQGTDGNLYGTTAGPLDGNPYGTVFQITTSGTLTTLYNFCPQNFNCTDGGTPQAGLMQATNGNFYGVTSMGGTGTNSFCEAGCGTVFSVSMGLDPFVQPNPAFGKVGHTVDILGNNLTETTQVTFNGTPAQFTVVSDTFIKATIPTGATTGTIQVLTPGGPLLSNIAFHVE